MSPESEGRVLRNGCSTVNLQEDSVALSTYLFYSGNCREAFDHYRSVFGSDFAMISTFAEGPPDMKVPEEERDTIMHVSLPVGSSMLMGSDIPSNMGPRSQGNNFSVAVTAQSREHADEVYAGLSDGGKAEMPMAEVFWGSYFGSCTDRFGISWMVSFDPPPG